MPVSSIESYSALRNTAREFETTLILRPSTNKEGIQDLLGRLQVIFERGGGRMQKIDNWGLRTLAYPVDGNKQGIYLYIRFLGGTQTVPELERNLRIYDDVIRYLTIVIDEDIDPNARPSDVDEETLDAATESSPDPLEIAAQKEGTFGEGEGEDEGEGEGKGDDADAKAGDDADAKAGDDADKKEKS